MADYSAYNSMIYLLLGALAFLAMRWASRLVSSKKRLAIEYREDQAEPPAILRVAEADLLHAVRTAAAAGNRITALKFPATSGGVLGFLAGTDAIRFGKEEEIAHIAASAGIPQRGHALFAGRIRNARSVLVSRQAYENAMLNGGPIAPAGDGSATLSSSSPMEKRRQAGALHLGFPGNFLLLYKDVCGLVEHYDI